MGGSDPEGPLSTVTEKSRRPVHNGADLLTD